MGRSRSSEILVVGAGPAGLAAAATAARRGARVTVVDDNPSPGGQIWREGTSPPRERAARVWLRAAATSGADLLQGSRVVASLGPGRVAVESDRDSSELEFEKLILATGARELFLPFPGWTLPGVAGAGGLQALVKGGLPIRGRRVVVAGSGPLLLAVAAYLEGRGADVRLVAEQAPFRSVARFGARLLAAPAKALQAIGLGARLLAVPYRTGCWPVSAHGEGSLSSVTLRRGGREWDEPCDHLACGFGLVPQTELAEHLGCAVGPDGVEVDEWQETTVRDVYCAGEPTGIGGVDLSIVEGRIAALAALGDRAAAREHLSRRRKWRNFAAALQLSFRLRDEIRGLARGDTIVCRCEDVTLGQLEKCGSAREAKLQTRSGMGPCQGRICGSAARVLFSWGRDTVRPPVFPARVGSLIPREESRQEKEPQEATHER